MATQGPYGSLAELTSALHQAIEDSAVSRTAGGYSYELELAQFASVPLLRPNIGPYADGGGQDIPDEFKVNCDDPTGDSNAFPVARVYDLVIIEDTKKRTIVQRAASRGIKEAIEGIDGFRYSFNNGWAAGMTDGRSDGCRFSYICQDSMQNKDRHANGAARTLKGAKVEEKGYIRKPTYDCKGSLCVKFSISKGLVEVVYKHLSIHPTIAERRPNALRRPRKRKESYQNQPTKAKPPESTPLGEVLLNEQNARPAGIKVTPLPTKTSSLPASNGVKRKRDSDMDQSPTQKPMLSLAELLKRSAGARAPPVTPPSRSSKEPSQPPPVHYDLPASFQTASQSQNVHPTHTPQSSGRHPAPYTPYAPYASTQTPQHMQAGSASQRGSLEMSKRQKAPSVTPAPAQSMFITLKQTPTPQWQPYSQTQSHSQSHPQAHPRSAPLKQMPTSRCSQCSQDVRFDGVQHVCSNCLRMGGMIPQSSPAFPHMQDSIMSSGEVGIETQFPRADSPDPWFPKR